MYMYIYTYIYIQYINMTDDGLPIFRNKSGTQLQKIKKKLQRLFKEYNLEITAESNQKIVNYLGITLNLKDGTFRPSHKPGDQMQYIHTESNHPPLPPPPQILLNTDTNH